MTVDTIRIQLISLMLLPTIATSVWQSDKLFVISITNSIIKCLLESFNAFAGFYSRFEFVILILFRVSSVSKVSGIQACAGIQDIWYF